MNPQKIRKTLHLVSTFWLTATIFYFMVYTLIEIELKWWVLFSLSGYSLLLLLFLISFYIFAIYNGLVRNKEVEKEHPLTRTISYMILYDASPLLGAIASLLAITPCDGWHKNIIILATGTFAVTFLFWIIIDPILNLIEQSMPQSIKLRKARLESAKLLKQEEQNKQRLMIEELTEYQQNVIQNWNKSLQPLSEELTQLLSCCSNGQNKSKIVDIGLKAWQIGGVACMQQLANIVLDDNQVSQNKQRLALSWQGIGEWRTKLLLG